MKMGSQITKDFKWLFGSSKRRKGKRRKGKKFKLRLW